MLFEKNIDIP